MAKAEPQELDSLYLTYDRGLRKIVDGGMSETDIMGLMNGDPGQTHGSDLEYSPGDFGSGSSAAMTDYSVGGLRQGKTKFTNSEDGFILGFDPADGKAKFYIGSATQYLNWTGTALVIAGSITATSGAIGGWIISATALTSNNVSINSATEQILMGAASAPLTGTGIFIGKDGSDYEFRAGDPAGAYVHWTGSNLAMTGAVISTLGQGSSLTLQGWQLTCVFSVPTNAESSQVSQGADDDLAFSIQGGTATTGETSQAYGQSFTTPSTPFILTKVSLNIFEFGTVTDDHYVEIADSLNGDPIATSDMVAGATFVDNTDQDFVFSEGAQIMLAASTVYYIRFKRTGLRDTTNRIGWNFDTDNNLYAGGRVIILSNGTWANGSDANDDFRFAVYGKTVDNDTVSWGSGTLTMSSGTTYSISAGSTGNMAAFTYIYFDPAVSTTVLQTTTTAANAVGENKILIGTAQNTAYGSAIFQIFGGGGGVLLDATAQLAPNSVVGNLIAMGTITGSQIAADTIAANNIIANTITGRELAVTIAYAGALVIDTFGHIRGGQTGYDTGSGFFIGYSTDTYKFSVGSVDTGRKVTWDGETLTASNLNIVTPMVAGEDIAGAGYALYVAAGIESIMRTCTTTTSASEEFTDANTWYAQSFTTTESAYLMPTYQEVTGGFDRGLRMAFDEIESGDVITVRIRSSLTGSDLAVATYTATGTISSPTTIEFGVTSGSTAFDVAVVLQPNTVYYAVVSVANAGGALTPRICGSATSAYSGGSGFVSTDAGANWSASTNVLDFRLSFIERYTESGRVYLATSFDAENKVNNFVGFSTAAASIGTQTPVQVAGGHRGIGGLFAGQAYYINNNNASPGTVTANPSGFLSTFRVGVATADYVGLTTVKSEAEEPCEGTTWLYQSFTTSSVCETIEQITMYLNDLESGDVVTMRLRSTPAGSNLASTTYNAVATHETGLQLGWVEIGLAATPNTVYYLVISIADAGGSLDPKWMGTTSTDYSGGAPARSTDSGANWGAATVATGELKMAWQENEPVLIMTSDQ